jgi:hypothetical protein
VQATALKENFEPRYQPRLAQDNATVNERTPVAVSEINRTARNIDPVELVRECRSLACGINVDTYDWQAIRSKHHRTVHPRSPVAMREINRTARNVDPVELVRECRSLACGINVDTYDWQAIRSRQRRMS